MTDPFLIPERRAAVNQIDLKEYGKLEQQVEQLTKDVEEMQADIKELSAKMDTILMTLSEAKGGWKTLMWVGGAAASIATGVSWVIQHVSFK